MTNANGQRVRLSTDNWLAIAAIVLTGLGCWVDVKMRIAVLETKVDMVLSSHDAVTVMRPVAKE